jgi:Cu/Ag efflux protein CusF
MSRDAYFDPQSLRSFMIHFASAALAFTILLAPAAYADEAHHKPAAAGASPTAETLAHGEVRRVDKDAKKITIKHGPIEKLDMPAHTMVFQVKDPAMLDQVKAGDKVKFDAEKVGGAFLLTRIEKNLQ